MPQSDSCWRYSLYIDGIIVTRVRGSISIVWGSDVGISNGSSRIRVAMKGQLTTPACVVNGSVVWHCSASGMVGDVDTATCRSKTPCQVN